MCCEENACLYNDLRAESPVFVGDGNKINKKEYLFMPAQRRVYVPDMAKMFRDFQERRLIDAYEEYLIRDRRDFGVWLREKGVVAPRQIPEWCAYWVDSGDAVFENRGRKEILTFIKDPYGCLYIPDSSAKGMLRTILLSPRAMALLETAKVRVELNWRSISPEVRGEFGLLGSTQGRINIAEYLLWLQMKQKRRGREADG